MQDLLHWLEIHVHEFNIMDRIASDDFIQKLKSVYEYVLCCLRIYDKSIERFYSKINAKDSHRCAQALNTMYLLSNWMKNPTCMPCKLSSTLGIDCYFHLLSLNFGTQINRNAYSMITNK